MVGNNYCVRLDRSLELEINWLEHGNVAVQFSRRDKYQRHSLLLLRVLLVDFLGVWILREVVEENLPHEKVQSCPRF